MFMAGGDTPAYLLIRSFWPLLASGLERAYNARPMTAWLVGIARVGRQKLAERALLALGFECFFPKFRKRVVSRGKVCWQSRYLLGRYFFVLWRAGWEDLCRARGVAAMLLSPTLQPLLVSDRVIRELKERKADGALFRPGQMVRVRGGPMAGRVGSYEAFGLVLMEVLGRKVKVRIDQNMLVA